MKKLMFAVVAAAAMVAVAEEAPVASQIVGYGQVDTDEQVSPAVGSIFFPIVKNSDKTFDLRSISVKGDDADTFMEPATECIKILDGDTVVIGRYAYISAEWLQCNFEEKWEAYKWAIGWWIHQFGHDYFEDIDNNVDTLQIKEPIPVKIGQAFLGMFDGNQLHFISTGEVVQDTTAFDTDEQVSPFFMNYLPVAIDLSDITVNGDDADTFMEPATECVKEMDGDTVVIGRYSYISTDWLKCNFEVDWEKYTWAIGWWNHEFGHDYYEDILNDVRDLQITEAKEIKPGFGFLGMFDGNLLHFNFPDPTQVPSKQE